MQRKNFLSFGSLIIAVVDYFLALEQSYFETIDRIRAIYEVPRPEHYYDYVIVGAGTSGCILANRLSVNNKVLLLDAGTTPPSLVSIPGFYPQVEEFPGFNVFYDSVPQTAARNKIMRSAVGKMLGGSYSHNAIIFNRGSRFDYDNWADILNDESYSYKNMLKYFKMLENYKGDFPGPQRGTQGLIPVETDELPISNVWFQAGRELGYPKADPNVVARSVFTTTELSRVKGRRCTTYTQYIEPILSTRKNLDVIRLAEVEKIEFERNIAQSVIYRRHGKVYEAIFRKELILSAGTFGTPVILFKSGIGPKSALDEAEIPVVKDLPVGKYLEDHPSVSLRFSYEDASKFINLRQNLTMKALKKYIKRGNRKNVLGTTGNGPQAFIASSFANTFKGSIWPDILVAPSSPVPQPKNNEFELSILNARPAFTEKTIGDFKLNTTAYKLGVRESTKISLPDYKLLQSKRIEKVLLEGIGIAEKILETDAFRSIGAKLIRDKPCSERHKYRSTAYWRCYLKKNVGTDRHPVGTNRMRRDENEGVVDTKFRVFGLRKIRIADASVFPRITSANINAAVGALAEKASDEILRAVI